MRSITILGAVFFYITSTFTLPLIRRGNLLARNPAPQQADTAASDSNPAFDPHTSPKAAECSAFTSNRILKTLFSDSDLDKRQTEIAPSDTVVTNYGTGAQTGGTTATPAKKTSDLEAALEADKISAQQANTSATTGSDTTPPSIVSSTTKGFHYKSFGGNPVVNSWFAGAKSRVRALSKRQPDDGPSLTDTTTIDFTGANAAAGANSAAQGVASTSAPSNGNPCGTNNDDPNCNQLGVASTPISGTIITGSQYGGSSANRALYKLWGGRR
ncbi:MAG: hypothetical protein Q9168_000177 [Polycauliona sp. 1 TL-2023]